MVRRTVKKILVLLLLLLPDRVVPRDAHSLQYSFNISLNEQQRCVVQVFMDRTPILRYDCDNENVLYEKQEVKTTNVSKDMKDTLKDVGDKMRRRLLHLKSRKICGDSSILKCQIDANGSCSGPWEFRLDGRRFLVFSPENGEYEIVEHNSNGKEIKTMWENDKEVNESLKKISMGDCKRWLQVLDRKKVLGTTAAPTTAPAPGTPPTVPATPTTAPGAARSKASTNRPITSNILVMILACLIVLWLSSVIVTG
ncbi:UL16-binding protein 3-like isoform 2-T2 [Glossophaga mutica]